jgi:hypothetical protein
MINCLYQYISFPFYKYIYEKNPLEYKDIVYRSNHFQRCQIKEQKNLLI